jgi:uncharacterized membrane protein (DUF106 family)
MSKDDDMRYNNEDTRRLNKEIKKLKAENRALKNENNLEKIAKNKLLISAKKDEIEKIQFSLFAKDCREQFPNCILHMPRQVN